MPDTPEFDQVRWKLAEDMTEADLEVLLANKEKLNDEEKEAFSNILIEDTPLSDDPLSQAIDAATTDTEIVPEMPGSPQTPIIPETPVAPAPPADTVTRQELDSFLESKRKEWEDEGKTKAEQAKAEEKIKFDLFGKGEVPADWNEAVNKFAPAILDAAEQRILAKLEKQNKEAEENNAKFKQTQQQIFDQFEGEFTTLAKGKLIPDPATAPDDYKKVHDQIIAIGDQNGKRTVTDAYKLWAIIPKEHGGGFETGAAATIKKTRIEAQKAAAGKIGSGAGAAKPSKGVPSWNTIHGTSLDDLLEQRLQQS